MPLPATLPLFLTPYMTQRCVKYRIALGAKEYRFHSVGASPKLHLRLYPQFIASTPIAEVISSKPATPALEVYPMRTSNWKLLPAIGALLLAGTIAPGALAQCGFSAKSIKPMSWNPMIGGNESSVLKANYGPSIVGMWHVIFTAKTLSGSPIPDTQVDNAVVVWHSDGTEIMNSNRPAQDGNFCLGVWVQTGPNSYFLNHIPWKGNDLANAPDGIGNPQGGAQILERVYLAGNGRTFSGTFQLTAYNADGTVQTTPDNQKVIFTGVISGTRITPGTSFGSLLN